MSSGIKQFARLNKESTPCYQHLMPETKQKEYHMLSDEAPYGDDEPTCTAQDLADCDHETPDYSEGGYL